MSVWSTAIAPMSGRLFRKMGRCRGGYLDSNCILRSTVAPRREGNSNRALLGYLNLIKLRAFQSGRWGGIVYLIDMGTPKLSVMIVQPGYMCRAE